MRHWNWLRCPRSQFLGTFDQNNHFSDNTYNGPGQFMVYQQDSGSKASSATK